MAYRRWKPNKAQREAYAEKMREAEEKFTFITSNFPIRKGCKVEYVDKSTNRIIKGEVVNSSYGPKTGQHTFTILEQDGYKVLVKGRNLYDRLLKHEAGEIAKNWNNTNIKEQSINSFDVLHKEFGLGKILNEFIFEKEPVEKYAYVINFKDFGEKTILSTFVEKLNQKKETV